MHDEDDVEDTVIRPRRRPSRPDRGADALDDTVLRRRSPGPAPSLSDVDDTVVRPRTRPASWSGSDLDDTVITPRRAASSAASQPVATPPEDTVVRPGRAVGRPAAPGAPLPPAPTATDLSDARAGLPSGRSTRVPSVRVDGVTVHLDRPVVIGRRPALPRIVRGPEPQLVTVRSPTGQVSSSHLLVRAEGEAVVVDDLRSTNGTVVRPAGATAFRMPAGASIVVLTGTVVEIGDGIAIEITSPHLRAAPADPTNPGTPRTPRERS